MIRYIFYLVFIENIQKSDLNGAAYVYWVL